MHVCVFLNLEICSPIPVAAVVNVVCCHVEVSVTGQSPVQRSPTECVCVCVCVCLSLSVIKCNNNHCTYNESR
jgi:hypothetical protein